LKYCRFTVSSDLGKYKDDIENGDRILPFGPRSRLEKGSDSMSTPRSGEDTSVTCEPTHVHSCRRCQNLTSSLHCYTVAPGRHHYHCKNCCVPSVKLWFVIYKLCHYQRQTVLRLWQTGIAVCCSSLSHCCVFFVNWWRQYHQALV
jgi:hypothetical protein